MSAKPWKNSRVSLRKLASARKELSFGKKPVPWTPHGYQKKGVLWLLEHGGAGLLLDPGLGKTSISLAAFKILQQEGICNCLLVIAPLRPCYLVWPKEREKWQDFAGLKMEILHGSHKNEALARKADVYVINPDGLPWLLSHPLFKKRFHNQILCVDESSKFRHTHTARFKTLKPYLGIFRRRWILTGSPAPRNLLDLFGQIFILDLGRALGGFITYYRNEFFDPSGYGGYSWKPTKGAEKKIYDKLRPLCLRMDAEDYIKLPPISGMIGRPGRINMVEVDLPPDAWKAYKQMENLFMARLARGEITAANAAVATNKCRQIASGGLYYEDRTRTGKRRWEDLHDLKTEAVVDLLEELEGQPTLVAYNYDHDLARLRKALGKDVPYIGGGVSPKQSVVLEEAWNNGDLPYLLVNPASVAHGLNLQGAGRAVVWHTLTWNWEEYDQLVRRIWRQGQTQRVFVYHIVARDTVDLAMVSSLLKKCTTQKHLLNALRGHYKMDIRAMTSSTARRELFKKAA